MESIFEVNSTDTNFVTTNGPRIITTNNSEISKNKDKIVRNDFNDFVVEANEKLHSCDNSSNNNYNKTNAFLLNHNNSNKNYDINKSKLESGDADPQGGSLNQLKNFSQSFKCTFSKENNINRFNGSSRGGYSNQNFNENRSQFVDRTNSFASESNYDNKLRFKQTSRDGYLNGNNNENRSQFDRNNNDNRFYSFDSNNNGNNFHSFDRNNQNSFTKENNYDNKLRFKQTSRGGYLNGNSSNSKFHSFDRNNQNSFANESNYDNRLRFSQSHQGNYSNENNNGSRFQSYNGNNNDNGLRFNKTSRGGYSNENFNDNKFQSLNNGNSFSNGNNNNNRFQSTENFSNRNMYNKSSQEKRNDNKDEIKREEFFHSRFKNNFGNEYIAHVPETRDVNDLFKEDIEYANNYLLIIDKDEDIAISGKTINFAVLDTWGEANFEEQLMKNIEHSSYVRPRKIQSYCIPLIIEGEDIKGHAETGSGKTAAFMIPLINMLMKIERTREPLSSPSPYVIVIEPTRELCLQVYEQGRKFANETNISVTKAYGQYAKSINFRELQSGCDILCATPGRLFDLIEKKDISLKNLKHVVFDEADYLLETNFIKIIRSIITFPEFPDKNKRQTLLFSATFPDDVQKLANDVLKSDHIMLSTKNKTLVSANVRIDQKFISVTKSQKKDALLDILKNNYDTESQETINSQRTLVFVKTRRDADLLALWLTQQNIKATTINGDRSQKQREMALSYFRDRKVFVLVATDVCARGIDIKDLDHVINFDLPDDPVVYIHRIGRTGRLRKGYSTSFFEESSDLKIARDLIKIINEVGQEVPEFLKCIAKKTNGYESYGADECLFKTSGLSALNDLKKMQIDKEKNLNNVFENDKNNLLTKNIINTNSDSPEPTVTPTLQQSISTMDSKFKSVMLDENQINSWDQSDDETND